MKLILRIVALVLKVVYQPFRLFPLRDKIALISRQSDAIPEDFLLIREDLRKHEEIDVVILAKKLGPGKLRMALYPFHMLRQMFHIATSKVVVLDGYCIVACVVGHKTETTVIQMWHATAAIKQFGWQIVGKPSGSSLATATIMHMHDHYDMVLAPSPRTAVDYCEAFHVDNDRIRYYGLPHLTELSRVEPQTLDEIRRHFSLDPSKKTVLYVPTFREGKCVNLQDLIDNFDFDNYQLIAKVHPIDYVPAPDPRVVYPDKFTTTQWMALADVVITDYSSLLVEAAVIDKPLFLYVYDLAEYSGDTGLNLDYKESFIAPIAFPDGKQLAAALASPYDKSVLADIRGQFVQVDVKNCRNAFRELLLSCFQDRSKKI
jgi:CDP-ribitol ribitolphosphotransferase